MYWMWCWMWILHFQDLKKSVHEWVKCVRRSVPEKYMHRFFKLLLFTYFGVILSERQERHENVKCNQLKASWRTRVCHTHGVTCWLWHHYTSLNKLHILNVLKRFYGYRSWFWVWEKTNTHTINFIND